MMQPSYLHTLLHKLYASEKEYDFSKMHRAHLPTIIIHFLS